MMFIQNFIFLFHLCKIPIRICICCTPEITRLCIAYALYIINLAISFIRFYLIRHIDYSYNKLYYICGKHRTARSKPTQQVIGISTLYVGQYYILHGRNLLKDLLRVKYTYDTCVVRRTYTQFLHERLLFPRTIISAVEQNTYKHNNIPTELGVYIT